MEDKYNIKEMFNEKISFLVKEVKNHLKNIVSEKGIDGLIELKEHIDGEEDTENVYLPDSNNMKKMIKDITTVDNPVITEKKIIYASKIDTGAKDTNNKDANIYRGEYYYLIDKDDKNAYLSSAINKKTENKHDFIIDLDTFSNNFVQINENEDIDIEIANRENEYIKKRKKKGLIVSDGGISSGGGAIAGALEPDGVVGGTGE